MSSPEGLRLKVRPAERSPRDTVSSTEPGSTSEEPDTRYTWCISRSHVGRPGWWFAPDALRSLSVGRPPRL